MYDERGQNFIGHVIFFVFFCVSVQIPVANSVRKNAHSLNPDTIRELHFSSTFFKTENVKMGLGKHA